MKPKKTPTPDVSDRMVVLAEQLSEAAQALKLMASELRSVRGNEENDYE